MRAKGDDEGADVWLRMIVGIRHPVGAVAEVSARFTFRWMCQRAILLKTIKLPRVA